MSGRPDLPAIAAVVIGRNEGARLITCLTSLSGQVDHIVYVDSGSTDGSVAAARNLGAQVVALDTDVPFTAARARNAGFAAACQLAPTPQLIQFVDGDCEVVAGWIDTAQTFLAEHPEAGVVCGRRRERFAQASVYNQLADTEWDTPIGQARACGGDALMRRRALEAVGGFDPALIAGEEPELCVRLRMAGWQIWRIDAEMTLHDAALTRFAQWWQRSKRGGHAYAEGAALHGAAPERHNIVPLRRALIWGLGLPLAALAGALLISPWMLGLVLAWPAQILRLRARGESWPRALFLTLAKLPEAQGALTYGWRRLTGARRQLIEYK